MSLLRSLSLAPLPRSNITAPRFPRSSQLFPFLDTAKPLDFNRCVTYRNHGAAFSGTSLLEKGVGSHGASVVTTVGCFGVGVKFGPALGEAAAAHANKAELRTGMDVFQSGGEELMSSERGEKIERAW